MRRSRSVSDLLLVLVLFVYPPAAFTQGLHEKIVARKEAAEKVTPASGWVELKVDRPYDETFDFVRTWLQKQEFKIELAERDAGNIRTPIEQTEKKLLGFSKAGTRIAVSLIKESASQTTIKIVVADYSKKGADPWSNPKTNSENTKKVSDQLRTDIISPKN